MAANVPLTGASRAPSRRLLKLLSRLCLEPLRARSTFSSVATIHVAEHLTEAPMTNFELARYASLNADAGTAVIVALYVRPCARSGLNPAWAMTS